MTDIFSFEICLGKVEEDKFQKIIPSFCDVSFQIFSYLEMMLGMSSLYDKFGAKIDNKGKKFFHAAFECP